MRLDDFLALVRGKPDAFRLTGASPTCVGHAANHTHHLVHADHIDVSVAFGAREQDYSEDWTDALPDPRAWTVFVDYCYRGNVVLRRTSVVVWGGRYLVPKPTRYPTEGFDYNRRHVDAAVDLALFRSHCPAAGITLEAVFQRAGVALS
jgi:hypothetical protein